MCMEFLPFFFFFYLFDIYPIILPSPTLIPTSHSFKCLEPHSRDIKQLARIIIVALQSKDFCEVVILSGN